MKLIITFRNGDQKEYTDLQTIEIIESEMDDYIMAIALVPEDGTNWRHA